MARSPCPPAPAMRQPHEPAHEPTLRPAAATEQAAAESALASRIAAGDLTAFEELVQVHRPRLVRIAARIAPDGRAEDAVQEVLLRAYELLRAGAVRPGNLGGWLNVMTRNAAIDQRRRSAGALEAPDAWAISPAADAVAESRAHLRQVLTQVASLPDDERDALLLRATRGAGHQEIGAALAVSPGQARQLVHRARRRLREVAAVLLPAWLAVRAGTARAADLSTAGAGTAASGAAAGAAGVASGKLALWAGAAAVAVGSGVAGTLAASPPAPKTATHAAGAASAAERDDAPASAASGADAGAARERSTPDGDRSRAAGGSDDTTGSAPSPRAKAAAPSAGQPSAAPSTGSATSAAANEGHTSHGTTGGSSTDDHGDNSARDGDEDRGRDADGTPAAGSQSSGTRDETETEDPEDAPDEPEETERDDAPAGRSGHSVDGE